MRSRDWSLVFFTTLSQWSIGIVVWLTFLVFFFGRGVFSVQTGLSLGNPVLLALILIGVATTSSFLHLGNPSNAPKALNNLSGSWLSREILAIGLYSLCLVAVFVFGWTMGDSEFAAYLLWPSSIAGLLLLWAMARVYLIPTIPAWNNWYTPLSFATTSLSLGLITLLLLSTFGLAGVGQHTGRFYEGALVAVLLLEMLSSLLHHQRLAKMDTGFDGPAFNRGTFFNFFLTRMTVLLFVCLALLFFITQADFSFGNTPFTWMYPVLALVVIQEFTGRFLFYSSYFRIGV